MTNQTILQTIRENKIVAIARGVPFEKLERVATALTDGGIRCIEVTFSGNDADAETLKSIRYLSERFGDSICVGAGTVRTEKQVAGAADCGARYFISPHFDLQLTSAIKRMGLIAIPGAMTPTEILFAHAAGADIVKVFPAGTLGVDYFKAVSAPIGNIPLMAVGGVDLSNITQFFESGVVCCGLGANIISRELLDGEDYQGIEQLARAYIQKVNSNAQVVPVR